MDRQSDMDPESHTGRTGQTQTELHRTYGQQLMDEDYTDTPTDRWTETLRASVMFKQRQTQRQSETKSLSETETISDSPREAVETVGRTKTVSAFQQKHPCQDVEEDVRVFAGLPAMLRLYHGPLRGHEKGTGPLSQHQVLAWGLLKAQTHMTKFSSS